MVKINLGHLLLQLAVFKELLLKPHEVKRFFVLTLLGKHLDVESNEMVVDFEARLLHKFEEQQVSNVQNLCLELQRQANVEHGFDGPLRIYHILVLFVQIKRLVLLLQQFVIAANEGEEKLIAQFPVLRMLQHSTFKQLHCFFVHLKLREDKRMILYGNGLSVSSCL